MATKAQIDKLEKLYKQRNENTEESKIVIPEDFTAFCELTTIKTGLTH